MKIAIVNDMFMAAEALRRAVVTNTNHRVLWIAENGRDAVHVVPPICLIWFLWTW